MTKSKEYARFVPRAFISYDREVTISEHLEKTKTKIPGSGYVMFRANDCYIDGIPHDAKPARKSIYEIIKEGISQTEVIGFLSKNGVLYVNRKDLNRR